MDIAIHRPLPLIPGGQLRLTETGGRPARSATVTNLFYLNNFHSFVSVRYLNDSGFDIRCRSIER
jgi:hypothetical protein